MKARKEKPPKQVTKRIKGVDLQTTMYDPSIRVTEALQALLTVDPIMAPLLAKLTLLPQVVCTHFCCAGVGPKSQLDPFNGGSHGPKHSWHSKALHIGKTPLYYGYLVVEFFGTKEPDTQKLITELANVVTGAQAAAQGPESRNFVNMSDNPHVVRGRWKDFEQVVDEWLVKSYPTTE